ncbi:MULTISPECIES: hypothetical protein [unclassified Oceanobacter]|uniref:hypothetical protein n=1 Tax=unclassified Oceanobacter TaxID=2620260 RepID=UPI002734DCB0|nr:MULTISPECIES: hypothetical protein [unclassified Oceanobacter]MDP2505605.1 hypothetical protein [Oceanobacter sp. 3_MG-2023]MDP2547187.1 hypothetical protein [Oceanobacter sp. 4_MG-2023]
MSLRDLLLLVLFAGTLSACGGGESVADASAGDSSSDDTDDTDDTDDSDDSDLTEETVIEALGNGTGADFEEGAIASSEDYVLVGGSVTLTIDGVDQNDSNSSLTSDSYYYTFTSDCSLGLFSIASSYTSTGSVSSTYRNKGCSGGDTITATLYSDASSSTELATATVFVSTDYPSLGTDSGISFTEGQLEGDLEISDEDSTDLSVNIVNPLSSNALVTDDSYIIEWYSDCADGEFSVSRETNSDGTFSTSYNADYTTCPGDNNLTLLLFGDTDTECSLTDTDSCYVVMTSVVTVEQGVEPKLGVLDDDEFYTELLVNGIRESEYGDDPTSENVSDELKLSAGGTMLITANIVDDNDDDNLATGTTYGVSLESSCVEDGTATLDSDEKTTTTGTVTFTYTANGCLEDAFSANLYSVESGELATQLNDDEVTGIIFIQSAEVGAITFTSVSEPYISLKNIGDAVLPKQSTVTFTVVDKQGEVVEGQEVSFELTNTTGGITLGSGEVTDSDVTDSSGQVTAIINSGTSHAVTSVRATTETSDGTSISTTSQAISITTGIADQDSFDIAVDIFNPGAYATNGTEVSVTVYAADQYQNPVADGTVVNFTAESGTIESYCVTTTGTCSVTWYSSGVRPGKHEASLDRVNEIDPQGRVYDGFIEDSDCASTVCGMTTITAYTVGESSYTDTNGNGTFDVLDDTGAEPYVSYPEAFRDDNWNEALDTNSDGQVVEAFFDFDTDGAYDEAPTVFQGLVCSDSAINADTAGESHCDSLMHVRDSIRIVQSYAEAPNMRFYTYDGTSFTETSASEITLVDGGEFYVLLQDWNGNAPANGTTLSVEGDGYEIYGSSGTVSNSIGLLYGETYNDLATTGLPSYGMLYYVSFKEEDEPESITVTATYGDLEKSVTID